MLAWMDAEALRRTRETGEAWFWSRSRGEYWHKGATSGNTLAVVEVRDDCDGDAILLRVDPAGPACHTGAESCFAPWLWRVVAERAATRPAGSYVAGLLERGVRGRRAEGGGGGRRGRPRRRLGLRRAPRRGACGPLVPQLRPARGAGPRSGAGRGGAPAQARHIARTTRRRLTRVRRRIWRFGQKSVILFLSAFSNGEGAWRGHRCWRGSKRRSRASRPPREAVARHAARSLSARRPPGSG